MALAGMTTLRAVNQILRAVGIQPVAALDTGGYSDAAEAERYLDEAGEAVQSQGWPENTEDNVSLNQSDIRIPIGAITGTYVNGETVTETGSAATGRLNYVVASSYMYLETLTGTFLGSAVLTGGTSAATCTGSGADEVLSDNRFVGVDDAVIFAEGYGQKNYTLRGRRIYDLGANSYDFAAAIVLRQVRLLSFTDLLPATREVVVALAAERFRTNRVRYDSETQKQTVEKVEAEQKARRQRAKTPPTERPEAPRGFFAGPPQAQGGETPGQGG